MAEARKAGWFNVKITVRDYPDRLLYRQGRHIWLEMKRPGGKPRPAQEVNHRLLRSRGETVLVIDDWRDLLPALDSEAAKA